MRATILGASGKVGRYLVGIWPTRRKFSDRAVTTAWSCSLDRALSGEISGYEAVMISGA